MDIHFCKGKIADVSVFGKAKSCKMLAEKEGNSSKVCQNDSNNHRDNIKKGRCCYNETIAVDVTDELANTDNSTLSHAQLSFVTAFFASTYHLFFAKQKKIEYLSYSPPLIYKDIQVLDQVFII